MSQFDNARPVTLEAFSADVYGWLGRVSFGGEGLLLTEAGEHLAYLIGHEDQLDVPDPFSLGAELECWRTIWFRPRIENPVQVELDAGTLARIQRQRTAISQRTGIPESDLATEDIVRRVLELFLELNKREGSQ